MVYTIGQQRDMCPRCESVKLICSRSPGFLERWALCFIGVVPYAARTTVFVFTLSASRRTKYFPYSRSLLFMGLRFEFDSVNKILLARFEVRLSDESLVELYSAIRQYFGSTDARGGIVDLSSVTE